MDFLDKETESLLKDCLDRENDYPTVLREKFLGLSDLTEERLRSRIRVLIDKGYISKMQWADNLPWAGRIEQKGRNYFREREIYIRAKLRQDPYFNVLDDESEKILLDLINNPEVFPFILVDANIGKIYENLEEVGLVKLQQERYAGDVFTGTVSLTQNGKNYFLDKEKRIEEILLLGDAAMVINIESQYNNSNDNRQTLTNSFNGTTIEKSPIQIGNNNAQEINFDECSQKIEELKKEIEQIVLKDDQKQQLMELIEIAEKSNKAKKSGLVKTALKEIWDFAKSIGSSMLVAYMSFKFGLS